MHLLQSKSTPGPSLKVNNVGSSPEQPIYINCLVVKFQYVLQVLVVRAEVGCRRLPWFLGVKTQGIRIKLAKPRHGFVGGQPWVIERNLSVDTETKSKLSAAGIQVDQVADVPPRKGFVQPFIHFRDHLHSIALDLLVENAGCPSEESYQVQHVIA